MEKKWLKQRMFQTSKCLCFNQGCLSLLVESRYLSVGAVQHSQTMADSTNKLLAELYLLFSAVALSKMKIDD